MATFDDGDGLQEQNEEYADAVDVADLREQCIQLKKAIKEVSLHVLLCL